MSFAGNIEKPFQNIQMLGQLNSHELADELRQHDIFIFASERESCSNSLLEAMHSGLPVLCRNSSSNPEILGSGGLLFDNKSDMLKKLDILIKDLKSKSRSWASLPLLARTHGQAASPTTLGKEFKVFYQRLSRQKDILKRMRPLAKFGGATGNFHTLD